jgi:hypothetical protein
MANHGGARAGAGRKRRAVKWAGPIAAAEQKIVDRLPALLENMMLLADGVVVEKADAEGGVDVYQTPPCRMSNQYLIDRILGRPTQAVEIGGLDGEPIPVNLTQLPAESLHDLERITKQLALQRPRESSDRD